MQKRKRPVKRLARKRKKNGAPALLEAIYDLAVAGLKIYREAEPMLKKTKTKTVKRKRTKNEKTPN